MINRHPPATLILLLLYLFPIPSLSAENGVPVVQAVRAQSAIRLDGVLDESDWSRASVVTELRQRDPLLGEPVSEPTEVLILYDRRHLYFGFRCRESDPKDITAKEMARDISLGEDDRVQVILDTFLDGRNAYWFQIGPRGSIGDALISENGFGFNKEWDGLWDGRARIHSQGWDAEIAIPFTTLSFRPGSGRWGLKILRHIRRKLESSYWPVANRNTYTFQVSDSGILEGLEGISQGIGLDINPYAITGVDQKRGTAVEGMGDTGVDLFYQLTPGIKTALTVNTDFAQTEVDTRQINLTRFPLFFPEKRDFFLDGSNYFSFGTGGTKLVPFFSRRLGLDSGGNPIPILLGSKVAGQYGAWSMGFMDVIDERDEGYRNFMVGRVRRNLGKQSSVGAIVTHGNSFADVDNTLLGADFKWASSSFRGNQNIALSLYGLKSSTRGLQGQDSALGAEFTYPNDFLNTTMGFRQIGKNFQPGIGYVQRTDIRESYLETEVGPRTRRFGLMKVFFGGSGRYLTDLDNSRLGWTVKAVPLGLKFSSGDSVQISASRENDLLLEDFRIHSRHTIARGDYVFTRYEVTGQSAPRRRLWASLSGRGGEFYDGSRRDVVAAIGYKVAVPFYVGLDAERDHVLLPSGHFVTTVSRLNTNLLFSPRVTLYTFLQYDNLSRTLGWQSRFRWILRPGCEIYVVWNSRLNEPLQRWELTESSARIKFRYNFRF